MPPAPHPTALPSGSSVPAGGRRRDGFSLIRRRRGIGSECYSLGGGRFNAGASISAAAGFKNQLLASNTKPPQVFSLDHSTKNAADIELVVDALEAAADMPWIELFVIVSGDGDFVPLIRRLHALGKRSFVATTSQPAAGVVNKLLPAVADHFHVIGVPLPPAVKLAPSGRKSSSAENAPEATNAPTAKKRRCRRKPLLPGKIRPITPGSSCTGPASGGGG